MDACGFKQIDFLELNKPKKFHAVLKLSELFQCRV